MKRGLFRVLTLAFLAVWWTDASAEILVTTNSAWRFRKGTSEASSPTNAWRALAFDDSTWSLGNAPFYYDTDPAPVYTGNTLLGDMQNGYTCLFLRQKFVVANPAQIATLTLRFWCDDGFVAWINGTLVTNYNQTSGNYAYTNVASIGATEPLQWFGYTLTAPQTYLVNGTNVIAVQAFNRPITSSDFVIDLELTSALNDSNPPAIASVSPAPGALSSLSQITVTFSEPVAGVSFSDLLLNGIPATGVNGVGTTYTFTVDQPPYGNVQISWDAGASITDFGSPPNPFNTTGPGATWQYDLVDTIPPTVATLNPLAGVTVRSLGQVEVTFSEPVTGVNASDLSINGSLASSVVGSLAGPYVFQFPAAPAGTVQVSWASGHGIRDTATTPNNFAGGNWSYTVDPNFNTAPVRINEFLTSYSGTVGLADEDGELQDWIELYNSGTSTVSLQGWSLTDEPDEPGKWTFPGVTLGPGQYLLIFASGKDRKPTAPATRLHANFKLNSAGDYLGLFNAESPRVVMSEFAPEFPEQRGDYSYGFDSANNLRYFASATPGAANGNSTIIGIVPPVHFNVQRGLFDLPFTLILNTELEASTIRYTTDGSEPTATAGQVYTGPLTISQTTIFRAAAFKANYLPSRAGTHTYIFLNQVIAQPNDPPGFPPVWIDTQNRTWAADYEMDPEITTDPQYSGLMRDSLRALPVISLVAKPEDMFDNTTGIYPKSQARGPSWERPASVEFIFQNDGDAVQIDCGVQMQGNSVRDPVKTAKHAFRFVFKGDYGPAKLRYRVFPDSPVEEFDTLTVRADFNNSWMHWNDLQRPRGQRIRDAFIKDSQRALSGLSAHNRFFHLYVNGLYWGVYDPVERPDAGFAVEYLGGEKIDYDVVNEGALVDGSMTAYNFMVGLTNLASNAQYDVMKQYLDVTHHIDYMLLHFYIGHEDWGLNKNWYTLRRRAPGEGFKYIAWDGELTLNSPTQNRVTSTDTASGLHTKLVANTEYRLDFADRIHKHLFNGGTLTPSVVAARYQKRIDEVDLAMVAESARWGDYRRDVHQYQTPPYELYTRNIHFLNEKNRLFTQYFPGRTTTVLNQLRTAGLYPATAAPAFSQHGGRVALGFNLTMSAAAGTIYYTTNGTDPRVIYTGAVSASARTYSAPVGLNSTVVIKTRALNGSEWSALNGALFQVEELGVPLRITEIMYNPIGGDPYEFLEVQNVGATTLDLSGFSLGGVSFVFPPNSVLTSGQIVVLASSLSPSSFTTRYPGVSVLGYFDDGLNNGGERLALRDRNLQTITSVEYDDGGGWPTAAAAIGGGPSLEIIDPRGDPDDPANWRASAGNNGSPGALTAPPTLGPVRLNEIMADNLGAVTNGAGFPDWIELRNTGGSSVSLSGWSLTDDGNPRKFVFPPGASIAAGGYLVVWSDSDFAAPGLHTGFALGRNGESVFLYDPGTNRMDALTFGLQIPNLTVGRIGAGAGTWQLCQPMPNAVNVAQSLALASNLVINEWFGKPVPGGDDWIELHNRHATLPASLQGLYLTTSNATFRIQSLSFIAAAGFAQLIADETAGADHVDFKIAAEGGTIALHDPSGAEINRVNYNLQAEGVSEGRLPNGSATIVSFPISASPGASNYLITYTGPTLNEVMAWNTGAVTNSAGRVTDWIELFNPGGATFSMAGMSLSDEPGKPGQWIFPAGVNVPANGYLVIWFDGDRPASTNLQANLNTGRSLDRRSGGVWLYNSAGQIVDFVEYGFQVENLPIGKNGGQWELLDSVTPGSANAGAAALGSVAALRINEWMANPASGDDWFELHNASDQPVSLAGLYVSDNLTIHGLTKSSIAPISFIGARGFVKFDADGSPSGGRDHVNFQLDAFGEVLVLSDASLAVIDGVYFGAQTPGVSAGRLPDGGDTIVSFSTTPSPDASNYLPLPNAVINEVLSHTDLPLEDAVELHNPTASPVDISGWFLSDDPANFKKFQIPGGITLPGFGYKVFYENQLNGGAGSLVPFTFDSVRGDEVWLSAADGIGNLTGFRSVARFGASANGVSFGRHVTSVGEDFVAMTQHTFGVSNPASVTQFRTGAGAANASPLVGPVVINEIMYHPVSGSGLAAFEPSEEEFIELQNITGGTVSLYDPAYPTNAWRLGGGIDYAFPAGVSLPAQGYLLIVSFDPATNATALGSFRNKYGVSGSVPVFGPYAGRLDNAGESVALFKPDAPQGPSSPEPGFVPYVLVEQINYSDLLPWPGADGNGASLQRVAATQYGNDPVNWKAESPTAGGSNTVVNPPNQPPVLAAISNQAADEGTTLNFTASATDPNAGDTLTFTLENAPQGATINSATGAFAWTPTEAQGQGTNVITVRVTDNGSPSRNDAKSFTVVVREVNSAPSLAAISDRTINEGLPLNVTATATDGDLPPNGLTYTLDAAPAGVFINPNSGALNWTPSEAQGPGVYDLTVRVTDNGSPALFATRTFRVTVNEENSPPVLSPVTDRVVAVGGTLNVGLFASDLDFPPNSLTFAFVSAPGDASLNATTGQLSWTPAPDQTGTNRVFTVRVTDNGLPNLSDTTSFTVTVSAEPVLVVEVTAVTVDSVALSWGAVAGKTYRVQFKNDLSEANWSDVPGDVTAGGATASKVDAALGGSAQRFYRVVLLN